MDDLDQPPIPIRATVTLAVSRRLGLGALVVVVFLAAMLSPLWLLPLLNRPRHTFSYTNLDLAKKAYFPVLNKAGIRPGEVIQMVVAYCNDSDQTLGVKIHRDLIPDDADTSTEPYFLADVDGSRPPGCATVTSLAHTVPDGVKPGRYYLSGTTTPQDGSVALTWRSEVFEVVAAEHG